LLGPAPSFAQDFLFVFWLVLRFRPWPAAANAEFTPPVIVAVLFASSRLSVAGVWFAWPAAEFLNRLVLVDLVS
jgi:hypothetical protein